MEDSALIFEEYIKANPDFDGNFFFEKLKQIDEKYNYYDYTQMGRFYRNTDNISKVSDMLKKYNVDVIENLKKTQQSFEQEKENFIPTPYYKRKRWWIFFHIHG